MVQFDERLVVGDCKARKRGWCLEGRGEECKERGEGKADWQCPCLVTALLRGKSLTNLGPRLTWVWGEDLHMGHREKCLVRTPWADRSSTSAALCCCHCYSKSLCLDHCGQRERQVRATQLRTAWAPTNHLNAAFGDDARAWFEEEGWPYSCIKQNRPRVIIYCFPPEVGKITLGGPIQNKFKKKGKAA